MRLLAGILLLLTFATVAAAQSSFDVIIRNGMVYDGSGGRPVKADVGARPRAFALALAARLGHDPARLAARLDALGLAAPSHVGLRLGAPAARALTLYFRITGAPITAS